MTPTHHPIQTNQLKIDGSSIYIEHETTELVDEYIGKTLRTLALALIF